MSHPAPQDGLTATPAGGLDDLLAPGLVLVVVGFNPSLPAWRTGHYYANPGNRFYRLLYESGLTPHLLRPEDDARLLAYGIGVTDLLAGVPSARAGDRPAAEYRAARAALRAKLAWAAPAVVCFNGRGVFAHYFGQPAPRLGVQPGLTIGASAVAVVPSSSGLANRWAAERLAAWQEVAALVRALSHRHPP